MLKRLLIIFLLGFSSGLPLALITSTLQAWFASVGMSIFITGSLSLLGLPYVYRFLFGPFLDRYALFSLGKRRSWMLTMQGLLLLGFNSMAWLNPLQYPRAMALLGFFLACCSSLQDGAIDAHRTEYLPETEQALGASLAGVGYRLAMLLAGGVALFIAQHAGFPTVYRVMGGMMIIGMITALWSPEPSTRITAYSLRETFIIPFLSLWRHPGCITLVVFIFLYKWGEVFTMTTSGILMPFLIQGLGFSLDTIAIVNKIVGVGAIVLGGLLAGVLLMRWSLYRALLTFGLLQAASNLLFVILAWYGPHVPLFALAVVTDNLAAGLGSTALVALFMRIVDQRFTATQFSILVAISMIPRTLSGPVGAGIQVVIGWVGLYIVAFLLAFTFIPFLNRLRTAFPTHFHD